MDPVLALRALAAILADDDLRQRFLSLTGYDAETLRREAGGPAMRSAVASFLSGHEPDLLRIAAALGEAPDRLIPPAPDRS